MIDGTTKIVGVLGWPVAHSLSPAIHNTAFVAANLNYVYVPLPVAPDQLAGAIEGIRAMEFAGANVTIPHKVAVMPYMDKIDAVAEKIGAVNTIVRENGLLTGYNTDADGFIHSLANEGIQVKGKKAILLGAGGAAKAVVCGLMMQGVADVAVAARNGSKVAEFTAAFRSPKVHGLCWQDTEYHENLKECELLINCTPLGMHPHVHSEPPVDWQVLSKDAVVCDLIYNPLKTRFLLTADKYGHKAVSGAGMLIGQGALAFKLWTGIEAPQDKMYETLIRILK